MTTNYHTAIATGAAANASVFNAPLGQLDAQVLIATGNADAATTYALSATSELTAARNPYATLKERLDNMTGGYAGGNIATLTDGAASAGQKVVTVDSTTGFLAGAYVSYALVGGAVEYNLIATVDTGTQLTLTTNIGTGGIANNVYIGMISVSEYQAANAIHHSVSLTLPQAVEYVGSGMYHPMAYGAAGNGSIDDRGALNTLCSAVAAGGGVILIDRVYLVDSSMTVPANVALRFQFGGKLTIGSGDTVTINGAVEAGDYQIFDGAGSVKNIISSEIRAAWFGVHPANSYATNDAGFARLLRTFPSATTVTYDAYNVPSAIGGHLVLLPAGIIPIGASVDLTNKVGVILAGTSGADRICGTSLAWHGASGGSMILVNGAPGCGVRDIALLGRGVAGEGLYLDRTDVGYLRSFNTFQNLMISDCTGNGIHISTADNANLYQVDNIQFYNITIWGCTGGVLLNNRNDLDIDFHTLRVAASYPLSSITPAYAMYITFGGCYVYGFEFGGGISAEFTDYAIKVENGYVQVFGGYSESTKLFSGDCALPFSSTINSGLIGFQHYPYSSPVAPEYNVYWNVKERSLNIIGGRVGNAICEGANSGGVTITDAQITNVPAWTGRTKYSAIRNARILRTTAGSGTDYILNWDGLTGTKSADTSRDVMWSNNFVRRDDYAVPIATGDSSILRQVGGTLQHWTLPAATAGATYPLDYSGFNKVLETGWQTARGGAYLKLYGNTVSFGADVPTAGTWKRGDVIYSLVVAGGGVPGWMCVTSGTFSAATDSTGDTTTGSYTITGVGDTSDFAVGDFVTVSSGFASTGPFEILAVGASTITINLGATSDVSNVTIATSDPVFKAMAAVAA